MRCLSIHLTDLCNSECAFCVVGSPLMTEDSVRYADVVAFLERHRGDGYEVVNLHGGEPTVHPRFMETLDRIGRLGYPEVHLQTNGIRLADTRLMRQLAERRVTKVIISLHGDSPELHEAHVYTAGGFDKALKAIVNAKSLGVHVRTNTVITKLNLERLSAIAQLCCDLGVDHLNFSNMHPVGSARFSRSWLMPRLRDMRPHLRPAVILAAEQARQVTLEGFPYCMLDDTMAQMDLGNEYRQIKLLIGDQTLSDYDTFMRERMRTLGDTCHDCDARDHCGGVYPEYIEYYGWDEFDASAIPSLHPLEVANS
jgi:MoaA/NifB/PqqE/SkfB family radical SAM enzyme